MVKNGNRTFVRITNKHIYDKIEELIAVQSITNGKVKLNRWIATTALTIGLSISFYLIGVN